MPASSAYTDTSIDFLRHMLRTGRAPTIDRLLQLAPDEEFIPPADATPSLLSRFYELRARYAGFQIERWHLENMKYGRRPTEDARLDAWVRTLLYHAKAKWGPEIYTKRTRLQFLDWLPLYLEVENFCWTGSPGLDGARQILRLAVGLPRFVPTRTVR